MTATGDSVAGSYMPDGGALTEVARIQAELDELRAKLPPPALRPECNCEWARLAMHNSLLDIESRGLEGFFRLFEQFGIDRDNEPEDQECPLPIDFRAFVESHNWRDPVRMRNLARDMEDTFNYFRDAGERFPMHRVGA
jgi:hypothetical protein